MCNYKTSPINGESIHGFFSYKDGNEALSDDDEEKLAEYLNTYVELGRQAVWFTARDRYEASIDREPLEHDGRRLRYVKDDEGGIFPIYDIHKD